MSATLDRLFQALGEALPEVVLESHCQHGDDTVIADRERAAELFALLRGDPQLDFDLLVDLTAVDHAGRADGPREPRFEVVSHLYSISGQRRLRVKVGVPEDDCEVDSLVDIWPAADWMEREVFDLYGIRFRGHPDLRRILLYESFEGHPLRKDYPKRRRQPLVGPSD